MRCDGGAEGCTDRYDDGHDRTYDERTQIDGGQVEDLKHASDDEGERESDDATAQRGPDAAPRGLRQDGLA